MFSTVTMFFIISLNKFLNSYHYIIKVILIFQKLILRFVIHDTSPVFYFKFIGIPLYDYFKNVDKKILTKSVSYSWKLNTY